jgi:hypothetical protein
MTLVAIIERSSTLMNAIEQRAEPDREMLVVWSTAEGVCCVMCACRSCASSYDSACGQARDSMVSWWAAVLMETEGRAGYDVEAVFKEPSYGFGHAEGERV